MSSDDRVPIKAYSTFLSRDWHTFPERVQQALGAFLDELQTDPDSPELRKRRQVDSKGRFGCEFLAGWVVYWRVEREGSGPLVDLKSFKPERIRLLEVRRTPRAHPTSQRRRDVR